MPTTPDAVSHSPLEPGREAPGLAIITNSNTPYRLAYHLRLVRELAQVRLHSVFTHDLSNSPWVLKCPPEVGAVYFGKGEEAGIASSSPIAEWRKGGQIIRFLKQNDIRAVVVGGYNDTGRIRIIHWCRRAGIPCFLWGDSNIRSDQAVGFKRRLKATFLTHLLPRLSGVLVCGSLGRQFYESYGEHPDRIFYVPYEPDYTEIRQLPDSVIRETAERFGLERGRRRIVYSGRIAQVKRVDLLLKAFIAIAAERSGWDLVIVGDGPLRAELQALVPQAIGHRIKWLGFQNDQSIVSAVYRNADVLCIPSSYEPWALVVNEAVSAGLAVVSSDVVGASAELVRDGVNGKLFPSGDLQALTAALLEVTSPSKIDHMKAMSSMVLSEWQLHADPVEGLRRALAAHNVIAS